ncbi:four-carbon acid sugar kinase family protein [Planococcus sp. CAU13]|uniref:four-carbon acid sugar kinase family protein n=1 Tax=Planococcus sp. CAU13 TaxID=1541197 RepID=UPI00052FFAEA|nr:four-carbon acid sugar kinase family protein [Planococcus sp. CAU13]
MKVGIIADDLTGANATGIRLAKKGFIAATVVFDGNIPTKEKYTSISIDTNSRYCHPDHAIKRVIKAYNQLSLWGASVVGKRIDSTIRGNIGVETDALLSVIGKKSVAVVVASFPDSGRIVAGGYLLVEGTPVQSTDVAKDPMNPIRKSHVPTLMKEQSVHTVAHISLSTVLHGKEAIKEELVHQLEEGHRIIVIDAVTNEEIDHIAEAMAAIDGPCFVPVDPGPLSAAYSALKAHQDVQQSKWIVTVGSATPLSGRQIRYLIDKTNSRPVYVNAEALASVSGTWDVEIERAKSEALHEITLQDTLIITTYTPTSQVLNLAEIAEREGVTEEKLANRITEGLAHITHEVIQQADVPIDGSFSSGGDVTAALCSVSKAEAIGLEDEVLPLAAYGRFIGGTFDGMPVVTKGGMVGEKQSIYDCVKFLKTKKQEGSV